mmetsp:Transcript_15819/g.34725  ORF Transcript_15819/g.34725 Transcript_15819/m.34725 type:complete len:214 (-) Transcript_15819:2-643(-)
MLLDLPERLLDLGDRLAADAILPGVHVVAIGGRVASAHALNGEGEDEAARRVPDLVVGDLRPCHALADQVLPDHVPATHLPLVGGGPLPKAPVPLQGVGAIRKELELVRDALLEVLAESAHRRVVVANGPRLADELVEADAVREAELLVELLVPGLAGQAPTGNVHEGEDALDSELVQRSLPVEPRHRRRPAHARGCEEGGGCERTRLDRGSG